MIPIGTTPTFVLTVAADLSEAAHVYATFNGSTTITKTGDDLTIEPITGETPATAVSVFLSQAETLALSQGTVQIQVNWTFDDGSRAASDIVSYSFGANLLGKVVE